MHLEHHLLASIFSVSARTLLDIPERICECNIDSAAARLPTSVRSWNIGINYFARSTQALSVIFGILLQQSINFSQTRNCNISHIVETYPRVIAILHWNVSLSTPSIDIAIRYYNRAVIFVTIDTFYGAIISTR